MTLDIARRYDVVFNERCRPRIWSPCASRASFLRARQTNLPRLPSFTTTNRFTRFAGFCHLLLDYLGRRDRSRPQSHICYDAILIETNHHTHRVKNGASHLSGRIKGSDTKDPGTMAAKRKVSAMAPAMEEPVDPADELLFLCLGGGNEVGRSCHILQYKGKTVMVSLCLPSHSSSPTESMVAGCRSARWVRRPCFPSILR